MSQIGGVTLNMLTRTGQFMGGLKTADKGLKGFAGGIKGPTSAIRRMVGAAFAIAGIGSFSLALRKAGKDIDALAKTSDALGMTTKALSGLHHAADLTGVSSDQMNNALSRSNRLLGEAAMGSGNAARWIDRLNLNVGELQRMSPDERFAAYGESIRAMGSQTERAAAAAALFGDRQGQMLPLLMQNRISLADAAAEAEALGLATSRVDAAKIEAMNDSMTKAKSVVGGLFRNIIIRIAPYVEAIADHFTEAAKNADGFGGVMGTVGTYIIKAAGLAVDAWDGLGMVWKLLQIGVQRLVQGVLWMGDRFVKTAQIIGQAFRRAWDVVKAYFGVLSAYLQRGWSLMRLGIGRFVAFVGTAVRRMMLGLADNMRRVKGMGDMANEIAAAGWAIGRATNEISVNAQKASKAAADGVADAHGEMARAARAFVAPLEAEGSATLQRLGATFRAAAEDNAAALRAQALGPRPSDRLKAFASTIATEAQIRAQAKADEIAEQQRHNADLAEIEEHHKHDLVALDREAAEIRARIEQERLAAMEANWRAFAGGMSSMLGNLSRLQESHSKKAQKIGLVAAKAKIGQDTAAAAMASYQALAGIPIVGPALGAAAATAAIAAGAVQMANASSGAIGGGGPSAPDAATGNHGGIHVPPGTSQVAGPGGRQLTAGSEHHATLVVDGAALDPYRMAEAVNDAIRAGYIIDALEVRR